MPASVQSEDTQQRNKAVINSDDDNGDRIIDGLRYPRQGRNIDQLGFELTTHGLHFHGHDWDIPLTQRRDELTKAFMNDAAAATKEPLENILNVRFIVNSSHLDAKLTVRHKAHESRREVQRMLSSAKWTELKSLYEPRQKVPRPNKFLRAQAGGDDDQPMLGAARQATSHNLSFFGRANVGAEGPEFTDDHEDGEEPTPYEGQQNAKAKRTNSRLFISVRYA